MLLTQTPPVEVTVQSQGTPVWLSLLTLAISLFALIVSGLQYRTHKAESEKRWPKVRMSAFFADVIFIADKRNLKAIAVTIQNTGSEPTQLVHLNVGAEGFLQNGLATRLSLETGEPITPMSAEPVQIPPFSSISLLVDGSRITKDDIVLEAQFGHGLYIEESLTLNKNGARKGKKRRKSLLERMINQ